MRSWKALAASSMILGLLVTSAPGVVADPPRDDQPTPIARGPRVSGIAQASARRPPGSGGGSTPVSCSKPGGGNYLTNCHGTGRPVNETWIAAKPDGTLLVAGANDYNSYNGQGQDGYYWSTNSGTTWNDAGPIDVFPHNTNNAAGDAGLAVDANGVVYYSSIFFNYYRCNVGGLELLRRDPTTSKWSYVQIAANSTAQFQDKPALAADSAHVWVSWTQFGSCSGSGVTSPIKVAVLPAGAASVAPTTVLSVPGSTYSQGSSIAADGAGGFWVTWEEWPSPTATNGAIQLAHFDATTGWGAPQTISGAGFTDLPSPLPGFSFRDNSFPALAVTSTGAPAVTWTSYDSGKGRAYLWTGTVPGSPLADSGGDQFFPAIASDGAGGVFVAFSQVNAGTDTFDQQLWHGGSSTKASTASSSPNKDPFFSGRFIGDYNGMAVVAGTAHPIWTDLRGPGPYGGNEMDSMTAP